MVDRLEQIALRTSLIYCLGGVLWILLSDRLLATINADPAFISRMQTYKGWAFVSVTGVLLYLTLRRELRRWRNEVSVRERAEELQSFQANLLNNVSDAIITTDLNFAITSWNSAAESLYGWSAAEVRGRPVESVLKTEHLAEQVVPEQMARHLFEHGHWRGDVRQHHKSGAPIYLTASISLIRDRDGNPAGVVAINRDITEIRQAAETQAQLEAQLRQAQKLESIGRLAGGVAHDFNNLLTVIQGYCTFLHEQLSADDPLREDVEQIQQASERAARLTRQLLAFSRKQILSPATVDLNELLANLRRMLERIIGEDVRLTTQLDPDLWTVMIDPTQLEQVILNLVVNARDAMPSGGTLTLHTRNLLADGDAGLHELNAPSDQWVLVTVSDTGHGMDEQVRSQIFEPFFTTKAPGTGTGLGLATVYGIIRQSGGLVRVDSVPGKGTSFQIYLPVGASNTIAPQANPEVPAARHGSATILLVEDDEQVRNLARTALLREGHAVLEARHGAEALELAARHPERIDLLVTDVVMPQLSGRHLGEQLKAQRPELRILFMSGYTDDIVIQHGLEKDNISFLGKPFLPNTLVDKVRELLKRPTHQ